MIPKVLLFIFFLSYLTVSDVLTLRANHRPSHDKVIVCYVSSWAVWRKDKGTFTLENLRPELCTHLVYAFAGLNATTWSVRSLDSWLDLSDNYGKDNYRKMTNLRLQYPHLKVLLGVGGWNEGSTNYSALASVPSRRSSFINSAIFFLKQYNFNGLDFDWEFPGKRGGSPSDRENFVTLLQELKSALQRQNYMLTASISSDKQMISETYNIPQISKYLDYIFVMAYDYHGAWSGRVLPNAPLDCDDGVCIRETVKHLISEGASVEKLVLGLAMYGRTFILASTPDSSNPNPIGMVSLTKGFRGPYTLEDGFMGYNEICDALHNKSAWTVGWDNKGSVPYAINKDHVIVYDNPKSIKLKVEYALEMNLAGVMVWSVDIDDFRGDCADQHTDILDVRMGTDFPLMRTINIALSQQSKYIDNDIKGKSSAADLLISFYVVLLIVVWFIFGE